MPRGSSSSPTRVLTKAAKSIVFCDRKRSRRTSMTTDRHPREGGGPASLQEQRDSRFRGNDELEKPMTGDGCRAELFSEKHRAALKAACAEDDDVWAIYANNFGPDGFDGSIDFYTSSPRNRTFVLFDGDELAGMSS